MSEKDTGGPAFPIEATATPYRRGMTLRDWFAGQALPGILAGYWGNSDLGGLVLSDFAEVAYEAADAMLEARK